MAGGFGRASEAFRREYVFLTYFMMGEWRYFVLMWLAGRGDVPLRVQEGAGLTGEGE